MHVVRNWSETTFRTTGIDDGPFGPKPFRVRTVETELGHTGT